LPPAFLNSLSSLTVKGQQVRIQSLELQCRLHIVTDEEKLPAIWKGGCTVTGIPRKQTVAWIKTTRRLVQNLSGSEKDFNICWQRTAKGSK
jgi:hypothetical protein